MSVTLYTTNCPKCKILKKKLELANIDFTEVSGPEEILKLGFMEAPVLGINEHIFYAFPAAVEWIKTKKGSGE